MKKIIFSLLLTAGILPAFSQQITYSEPQTTDTRNLNFDIIGKLNDNYLIYKNLRNSYAISVYDQSMNLKDNIDLQFMPDRTLNADFIAYPDHAWMIYQYQKKNIIYCMAVKINSDGKLLTDPVVVDTSAVSFFADNKIYSSIYSEDKKQIMIFKIQKKNDRFNFTTLLFDDQLQLQHKSRIETGYRDKTNVFSDFFLSNKGNMVFTAGNRSSSRDYISDLAFISKRPFEDSFSVMNINLNNNYLDEVKLKVDNLNSHYILNSFYYTRKRGNTQGLFTAVIQEGNNDLISETFAKMNDTMRSNIKEKGSDKFALNDFFIRDVILKKNGGFLIMAEDFYSQSRSTPWNRYDYLYGYPGYYSPYYYYSSPYYNYYGNRYMYNNSQTRYYYNNILVMSMDSVGKYDWSNVIHKSQYDDESDNFLSYSLMITGGKLHFLFNELSRRQQLLNDRTITGNGDVNRNPPLHNLDRGYDFMPRYGKQVSASEIIIPCMYRNYICFAKIQFQ